MSGRRPPILGWGVLSTLLGAVAFCAYVAVVSRAVEGDANTVEQTRQGFAVYAGIVLFKGLLPQGLLTFVLYRLLHAPLGFEASPGRVVLGVFFCTGVSALLAGAVLFRMEWPGLPPVTYRGVANLAMTVLELTVGLALASWFARLLLARRFRAVTVSPPPDPTPRPAA